VQGDDGSKKKKSAGNFGLAGYCPARYSLLRNWSLGEGVAQMSRLWNLSLIAVCTLTAAAPAQGPQFRWRSGQVLTYRVSQSTEALETLKDQALKTTTKLDLVKKWQVTGVDEAGTATLQMTLVSLKMENMPPSGEAMIFDSANPAKSHEQLRDEMAKYVGPPLTVVRIDARGQLVEVKECKFGPETRLQCDLPFKLVLPAEAFAVGKTWDRSYQIKLDPPQGAGETYDAAQTYTCRMMTNGTAIVHVATALKTPPESAGDKLPLLPLMPEGDVSFDTASGLMRAVRYQFGQDLAEHRGEGSKYQFKSIYTEDLVESK
jgi:hypothetical protein